MIAIQPALTPQQERETQRVKQILCGTGSTSSPAESTALAAENFVPLPPVPPPNGTKIAAEADAPGAERGDPRAAESSTSQALAATGGSGALEAGDADPARFSYRGASPGGTPIAGDVEAGPSPPEANPLQTLIQRALSQAKRGRPSAFDDHARGKLVALLALGLSVRQSATVLGVSHPTILRALNADPELREEITAARYQAQLQPLGCVIREAQRSWRAATWLLKYMDGKLAGHEETPDEQREREHRERVEDRIRFEERTAAIEARERKRKEQRDAERLAQERAEIEAMFPRRKRKQRPPEKKPGDE